VTRVKFATDTTVLAGKAGPLPRNVTVPGCPDLTETELIAKLARPAVGSPPYNSNAFR